MDERPPRTTDQPHQGETAWGERRRQPEPGPGTEPPPPPAAEPPPPPPRPDDYDLFEGTGTDWRDYKSAPPPPRGGLDPTALFVALDGLRRMAPAELQERVTGLIREVLMTLRSLIDWYLERLDRPAKKPKVEDIPID
jgi:hypothetical protein